MPKQIGFFADVSNLYYCINKKFNNKKLNYTKYMEFISDLGDIIVANAYGAQIDNEAVAFINHLKESGFAPKYKTPKTFNDKGKIRRKADWDVGIAVDVVDNIEDIDFIVLGTADSDFKPLVDWILDQDKEVIIFACNISKDLHKAKCIEIPESLLE